MEDQDNFHPNWVALATVKFKPKLFVKSSGTEQSGREYNQEKETKAVKEDGESRKFYEDVLQLPSTSQSIDFKRTEPEKKLRKRLKPFNKEIMFKMSIKDDALGIEKMLNQSKDPDINAKDRFGWTGLMMAACEGSVNSFRILLLKYGADLDVSDKKGNTASSLAEKKGYTDILEIVKQSKEAIEISDDDNEMSDDQETKFCEDCGIEIKKSTSNHQSSTVHLFSCKFKGSDKIKAFGIPRSNRGYQMMRRFGWDGNSALGAKQNGKLYPIRTVLRKKNTGLGTEQGSSKITHFEANDTRAVHFRPPPRALTKREIHENDLKDKRLEQRLRRELTN